MRKLLLFAALASMLALALAGIGTAGHGDGEPEVTPTSIMGNPSCAGSLKIDPVTPGTYDVDFGGSAGTITITVTESYGLGDDGSGLPVVTDAEDHIVTSGCQGWTGCAVLQLRSWNRP